MSTSLFIKPVKILLYFGVATFFPVPLLDHENLVKRPTANKKKMRQYNYIYLEPQKARACDYKRR